VLIAHLSDLHLRNRDDAVALERQLDRIVARSPDHLVITGDLLDRWNPPLLARVLDALQDRRLLHAERVTILHGNHDLASSGGHPRRRADLWRLILRFWDPPPVVRWRRRRFYDRIASRAPTVAGRAPFTKTLQSGVRIAVIDTVPLPWAPVRIARRVLTLQHAIGRVRTAHATWLAAQRGAQPLVVLIHHYPLSCAPFIWRSLGAWQVRIPMDMGAEDRARFWQAAHEAQPALVLCGHVHRARLERYGGIPIGLNGQSGADWAGRTIAFYDLNTAANVVMDTERAGN
jgi:3',5'-cyclic AMP phosphodiesterase CpdA